MMTFDSSFISLGLLFLVRNLPRGDGEEEDADALITQAYRLLPISCFLRAYVRTRSFIPTFRGSFLRPPPLLLF